MDVNLQRHTQRMREDARGQSFGAVSRSVRQRQTGCGSVFISQDGNGNGNGGGQAGLSLPLIAGAAVVGLLARRYA